MFSRLSGLANTVLHELSGDGEGSEYAQEPVPGSGTVETMSEDQMENLAHYEQLVIQLKELIQQKDAEIQQKCDELQQKETQFKSEREAADAKVAKIKLQAKAKVATLNKQIEELKRTAIQVTPDGSQDTVSASTKEKLPSTQSSEESISKLQGHIDELTRQLQDSQNKIGDLANQLSKSQETIANLTHQLQDNQENVTDLTRALQESGDAARELHKKQEKEIRQLQRKLEEQSETLGSRTQVVQMLEQELQSAELQKQVLSEQFREMDQELHSLRESLDNEQKENGQQIMLYKELLQEKDTAYQRLQEELNKERTDMAEFEMIRAEIERGKQVENELELVKRDLEMERDSRKVMEESFEQLDMKAQDDRELLRAELEREFQEEMQKLRADLEKEKGAQNELAQLRSELEEKQGAQEELVILRSELEKSKTLQEEVQHLKAELDERKKSQEQLEMQLERSKSLEELMVMEKHDQQAANSSRNEPGDLNVQLEDVKHELKRGQEDQLELLKLREELQIVKESLADFDQVRNALEKGQETLLEFEKMKQELEKQKEALIMVHTLQQKTKEHTENISEIQEDNFGMGELSQQKPVIDKEEKGVTEKSLETDEQNDEKSHEVSDSSSKTEFKEETFDIHILSSPEDHQEQVPQPDQMLQFSVVDEQSHSISQELVVDVGIVEVKEKQLSLLMLDLMDTQEEITRLKEEMTTEQDDCSTRNHIKLTHFSDDIQGSGDSDILSLKQQVQELKCQLEVVISEKEDIALKLQNQLEGGSVKNVLLSEDSLDLEKQNILAEQVKSLENESKSKDLKISALQKDLDNMNLLLSEKNTLSKLQDNQLEEQTNNILSLKEMVNLSQSKEERLSEALASNECEIVSLKEHLSLKSVEIESLQHSLAEREQQIAEVSVSLSDKMVLLNEEKYSMGQEIKSLKKQLSLLTQEQSDKVEETLQTLRMANTELGLQIEIIAKEKSSLQEALETVQLELGEVKNQLETVSSNYLQSQETVKSILEEKEMLHTQLQDQKSELEHKQTELGELQLQVENQTPYCEQHPQFSKKPQSSLDATVENRDLEHQQGCNIDGHQQNEGLYLQVEHQKKEIEHLKRKLQAALISRKELTKKVSKLEKERNQAVEKVDISEEHLGIQRTDLKSEPKVVPEQNTTEACLERQLCEKESELQDAKKELDKTNAANEQLQHLLEELRIELEDKTRHIESLNTEQTISDNTEQEANLTQLENKIMNLEQDKENLQKKVQEALNSRKDTIKIAKEKDRHHREQLKQQKEEFNLLQEKYEMLQKNQINSQDFDRVVEERAIQTEGLMPVQASEESTEKSYWGEEWVDFSPGMVQDNIENTSHPSDKTLDSYQEQLNLFQDQKNELELKALHLEEKLNECLKEVSHLHATVDHLTTQLQQEEENCHILESQASILKTDLENRKQEMSSLQEFTIVNMQDELTHKNEEVKQLKQDLEESSIALKDANLLILGKDDIILSLKSQLELKEKEYEENRKTLELQVQEVQQKHEDVEEEKGKQQLQRKLQAALISRKDALKESKALKLELETIKNEREDLTNRLQIADGSVGELNIEKEMLLKTLSAHKEERDRLITEMDKCLLKNQNLEASCESLKLALEGLTQDKEGLTKDLEYLKLSQDTKISEWQEKMSDLQKEYETLLQSYENVSDETDRMKRAVETVRQEKQELFAKIKNVEAEKKEIKKELEESEQEIENMKEKMRKFAKSKQQKILELEEENDRLRGEQTEVQKPSSGKDGAMLKEELEKAHSENNVLKSEIEMLKSEKDNLTQETNTLRHQLQNVELNLQELENRYTGTVQEDIVHKKEAVEITSLSHEQNKEHTGESVASEELLVHHDRHQQIEHMENISQLQELILKLENGTKVKENEIEKMSDSMNTFKENILTLESRLTSSQENISMMESEIANLENKYQTALHDLTEANKQRQALEMEKDELEERLMNQMAELNGSIGNFQQDAHDLKIKNESLQRELEYLTLQMEEERRQLVRQKEEALSKVHTEYEEKLKSVHQGGKSKTQSKELQELLKEKQQEVRHLQKDCIRYQETISGLERTIKALEFVHNECEKEKVVSNERVAKAVADTKKAQADLTSVRVLLDDTQSEAARILAENLKLKEEIRVVTENTTIMLKRKEDDLEKKLEQERDKHLKQIANLQEKINMLLQDKQQLEGSISSLQGLLEKKDQELKDLQRNLNQNIANLAAFTRSMCSLQDDRDRVVEESKKWNEKFSDELQKRDNEIRDKENQCTDLKNKLLIMTSQADELKAQISRLQLENQELTTTGQSEVENLSKTRDSLLEEKAILSSCLEEEQKMHHGCQEELKLRSEEAKDQLNQLEALNTELTQLQSEKENLLDTIKRLEAEVQDWKLQREQIQTDLQASKSLTEQLYKELEQKEQDVMQLLSARDEAVNAAVGELNELHAVQCKALKERLEGTEEERKCMQAKLDELKLHLKANQEDADRNKAQLQAFTKSMCSLQEERERVLSDYQQLEQKHLDAILAKDGLIQEAAAESNKLREELRFLRGHNDDLNAQNAKLNAQLTRYREDLKEIISLKDSQLKQLLGEKLQDIEKLRFEQNNQEQLLNQEKGQKDALQQELDETKKEKQRIEEEVDRLTPFVSQLQTENEAVRNNVKQREQDVQTLKDELLQLQKELDNAKEEVSKIQIEAQQRVQDAEDDLNKKLKSIQHDTGILRNETETAEERVAELARDLMESEQRLLSVQEENASLKAQVQAFGGSMRSLQDSHDIAQEELMRLQEELKEIASLNEELSIIKAERDNLNSMLSESREEQQRIQTPLKELMSSLQVREEEISKLTSDLQASQIQLQNLSRAMGSLQEDRDRLQRSLKTPPKETERTLQSPHLVYHKDSSEDSDSSLLEELKGTQAEIENVRSQLGDALKQVHQKELRIQQLNVKLSQMFEEKNTFSLQLRGSNHSLREAVNRCSSLERQLQEMRPKSSDALLSDSAPGAPQEKKEPQTEADRQLMEIQQRYLELKQQNNEHEHIRSTLELQLREERQRAEDRIQELEENMNRLRMQDWSVSEEPVDPVPHELSLLMEPQEAPSVTARSSSLRRLLRLVFCSRTKTPLLASLYLLLIHVLLFLCLTGHL